jgi:hypothetical protein
LRNFRVGFLVAPHWASTLVDPQAALTGIFKFNCYGLPRRVPATLFRRSKAGQQIKREVVRRSNLFRPQVSLRGVGASFSSPKVDFFSEAGETLCDEFVNLEGRREKRRGAWEQIQAPLLLIDQEFVYLRDHLLLESILDASIIKLFIRQPSIRKNPYRQQFSTMECEGLRDATRFF